MKVVKVQKEAQEGSDRSSCPCSLTSYNTSGVLPLAVNILFARGKGKVTQLGCQGQSI